MTKQTLIKSLKKGQPLYICHIIDELSSKSDTPEILANKFKKVYQAIQKLTFIEDYYSDNWHHCTCECEECIEIQNKIKEEK